MIRVVGVGLLVAAPAALAQSYTHEHALGLTLSGGGEYGLTLGAGVVENALRAPLEVGVSAGVTEHTEITLRGRVSPPTLLDVSGYVGLRNARGERLKTFFDLELGAHFTPHWTIGARVGFGLQYELSEVVGVYGVGAVQGGGGQGLRLSFELCVGVQFRTYVLP